MYDKVNQNKSIAVKAVTVIACLVMAFIDGVLSPPYALKSACKIVLFGTLPVIYAVVYKDRELGKVFKPSRSGLLLSLILGFGVYGVIVGGYFLFRNVFDFSAVTKSLVSGEGVTKDNFIYVAIYISLCNSFLEEFFFRGFAFLRLKKMIKKKYAYIISSVSFAVYHVAFMLGWFDIWLFLLLMLGLIVGGVIFDFLDDKTESVYPSWIFHMFSNFATNTVGLILFSQQ